MRTTHELAKLLMDQPDMPCLTWGSGSDGVQVLASADFRTTELCIVGDEIRDKDNLPKGETVELKTCIIIE